MRRLYLCQLLIFLTCIFQKLQTIEVVKRVSKITKNDLNGTGSSSLGKSKVHELGIYFLKTNQNTHILFLYILEIL